MMISLLSLTYKEYVEAVAQVCGRGRLHAGLFYDAVMRTGRPPGIEHPGFKNAGALLLQMLDITDLSLLELVAEHSDGATGKFLLKTAEGLEVEAVCIPMQSGGTLCISSQIGCRMGCTFCETGRMGLLRNLTTAEIVAQVFVARHILGFKFTNVVFMGMGEPFDNYENVLQAAKILIDPHAFSCGKRNVTISTSGRVEEIERFTYEKGDMPNLAVSINAPDTQLRNKLMPINRKYSMGALYAAMQTYNTVTGRKILAAYVLLRGFNDKVEHAAHLAAYLRGLDVKLNIIPYNPQSKDRFQPPEEDVIDQFVAHLRQAGYQTLLRVTKGREIMAACGQLGNLALRRAHV